VGHPRRGGVRGRAQNRDPTVRVLDHREHLPRRAGQGVGFEKIAGQQGVGLGAEEVCPGGRGAFGGRVDTGLGEYFPGCRGGEGDLQYQ
jgi:hypothetical protein